MESGGLYFVTRIEHMWKNIEFKVVISQQNQQLPGNPSPPQTNEWKKHSIAWYNHAKWMH